MTKKSNSHTFNQTANEFDKAHTRVVENGEFDDEFDDELVLKPVFFISINGGIGRFLQENTVRESGEISFLTVK